MNENAAAPAMQFPPAPILLLTGNFGWQAVDVAAIAPLCGWQIQKTDSLTDVPVTDPVRAVFCIVEYEDLREIHAAREHFPQARIVACVRFSFSSDWERMEAAGAYQMLRLPLDRYELETCLGFLSSSTPKAHVEAPPPTLTVIDVPRRLGIRQIHRTAHGQLRRGIA